MGTPNVTTAKPTMLAAVQAPGLIEQVQWGAYATWQPGYQPPYGPYVEAKPVGLRGETLPRLRAYLDTVVLSHCWDDWEAGGCAKVQAAMNRKS